MRVVFCFGFGSTAACQHVCLTFAVIVGVGCAAHALFLGAGRGAPVVPNQAKKSTEIRGGEEGREGKSKEATNTTTKQHTHNGVIARSREGWKRGECSHSHQKRQE